MVEGGAYLRGNDVGLEHLSRIGADGVGIDAVCEDAAATIDDLAALGGKLDRSQLLAVGARHHVGMLDHLQIDEPRFDRNGPHGKEAGAHEQPGTKNVAPVRPDRRQARASGCAAQSGSRGA